VKGDFSRQTFARKNHYSSVRMQQGRVQLDADWNEQADIVIHREQTTTRDIIGGCGGPLHDAAFAVRVLMRRPGGGGSAETGGRPGVEVAERIGGAADAEREAPDPSGVRIVETDARIPVRIPIRRNVGDDFALGAGRYYVDGILCENEKEVAYSDQPDLPDATKLGTAPFDVEGRYLLYLDVWQRHLTALDDPRIRETALGGPDTATRAKTVWQAKLWKVPAANGVTCPEVFAAFLRAEGARRKGLLNASAVPEAAGTNPCIVPPSAGYRGLENLLYRIEVHTGGQAADVSTNTGSLVVASFDNNARNRLTLNAGPAPAVGTAVELYPSKAGSDPLAGRLYFVTAVNNLTLTLNQDIQGLEMSQQPRLRVASATFKWSRQNGSVVTKIETVQAGGGKQVTVQSLGPDDDLGFSDGDWVELTDDLTELHGEPGQLTQIVKADKAALTVDLKDAPAVLTSRNAKMRRWDGIGPIRTNPADPDKNWIAVENGLRIQFTPTGANGSGAGVYATGDYWTIPTRTATADRESGQIEWPTNKSNNRPEAQPPEGILHHYCPLALLDWTRLNGVTVVSDCRRLFPPVTELTTLHYVSGTGQEATPVLPPTPQSLVELLHPLVVGVSNGGVPVGGARVVFELVEGELNPAQPTPPSDFPNGRLSAVAGGNAVVISPTKIEVRTDDKGLASCKWELSPVRWNQQVVASLLGPDLKTPIHLPVRFNANLSVAREVAYEPGECDHLNGVKTVQEALDKLCSLLGLSNEPGVHVTDVTFGRRATPGGPAGPLNPSGVLLPGGDQPERPSANLTQRGNIQNDFDLACDALAEGLTVTCDRELFRGSVRGKPTCFVTLELPFPTTASDKQDWGLSSTDPSFIGYRQITLAGAADAEESVITWRPTEVAGRWLRGVFTNMLGSDMRFNGRTPGMLNPGRVLARLTLKGNYIWSSEDASLYLDGELFGVAESNGTVVAARAPSGDGRRGGDLELWFWLVHFTVALEADVVNVGNAAAGLVELSGPAPQEGATVQLSVSDPTVAALSSNSVVIAAGQTRGSFEVRGLRPGQVTVRAAYAGGERQDTLRVQQPQAPLLKVRRFRLIRRTTEGPGGGTETVVFTANEGTFNNNIQLPASSIVNIIEVEFTGGPVNQNSVRQGETFLVRRLGAAAQTQAGQIQWVSGNVVRWNAATGLQRGTFSVALLSGTDPVTNQPSTQRVTATDGRALDGEPTQLPSGNNTAEGTFSFRIIMA
jgi:hypothetical protein